MNEITIKTMMNFMFDRRATNLPPQGLAEIFDRLLWCLDRDGGFEVQELQREWLQSSDLEKVRIALSMTEVFPYETREEMAYVFDKLTKKFPSLIESCNAILINFDKSTRGTKGKDMHCALDPGIRGKGKAGTEDFVVP